MLRGSPSESAPFPDFLSDEQCRSVAGPACRPDHALSGPLMLCPVAGRPQLHASLCSAVNKQQQVFHRHTATGRRPAVCRAPCSSAAHSSPHSSSSTCCSSEDVPDLVSIRLLCQPLHRKEWLRRAARHQRAVRLVSTACTAAPGEQHSRAADSWPAGAHWTDISLDSEEDVPPLDSFVTPDTVAPPPATRAADKGAAEPEILHHIQLPKPKPKVQKDTAKPYSRHGGVLYPPSGNGQLLCWKRVQRSIH